MFTTWYEMLWLFFLYAFSGWILETLIAAVRHRRFVNRGLINGPLCITYGITAIFVTIFFQELSGFWLFSACAILITVVEWIAGHLIEYLYHERWWNYSNMPWNLDGYICVPVSVFRGVLCWWIMEWGNFLLLKVFHLVPGIIGKIVIWILFVVLCLDVAATLLILSGRSRRMEQWEAVDSWLTGVSNQLAQKIYTRVDARIRKAYPQAAHKKKKKEEAQEGVFAYGCSFDKIVWLFVIGSFLGDITETIFCRFKAGVWMSRSSLVWGPFSIVWGFAIAAATALLYRYRNRSDRFLFLVGTCLGGVYEYVCSVLSELVFGVVFWDYSQIPFNLGGRINLLYCFFWGIAAVVWFKMLYPYISTIIEQIPMKAGKIITRIMVVFMCCNMAVSALALVRSDQRSQGVEAASSWQEAMDIYYPDEKLQVIYPNMIDVE